MIFAISGVTLTGNLGGVAMLQTVRQEILRRCPGASLALLSISPRQDREAMAPPGLTVVPSHWLPLICFYLPLSLLVAPFHRMPPTRWLLRRIAYFRTLLDCAALFDVSGIAFVDGRGPALLAYNTACCAPAFLLGRPVYKLAQTMGPFEQPLNRTVARWALSRCMVVVPRGPASGKYLAALGLAPGPVLPDITFCLDVPATTQIWAAGELQRLGCARSPVMLSPSRVLQIACARKGVDLVAIFASLVARLRNDGLDVVLLAHSRAAGIAKNDDTVVCAEILARLAAGERPAVLSEADPVRARALIGAASIFVGCRYHALVASYAMGVPSLAISWNHKYADLAAIFGCEQWLLDAAALSTETLHARVQDLRLAAPASRRILGERLPAIVEASALNFAMLEQFRTAGQP